MGTPSAVHYIPIFTTLVALAFGVAIFRRWRARGGAHLLWWGFGMLTYGAGTITEATTTLFGWHEPLFRAWYITGALLGGAPLAQGTVYLILSRKTANRLSALLVTAILIASTAVLLSPINYGLVDPVRLSGKVFVWQWVRAFSPFINLYAAVFLIGGAAWSAARYWRQAESSRRAVGNVLIAIGALLPGIGGTFTRFGHVEVLYVTEFLGLLLIFGGYHLNTTASAPSIHRTAVVAG